LKPIAPAPLALRESRWQRRFLVSLHVFAVLTAATLPQPWLLLALGFAGASYCRVFWPFAPFCELAWQEDGLLAWRKADGSAGRGQVLATSLVTPHLWLLNIRSQEGLICLPVWFDSADPQALRRWRIYLRWKISEQQGNQQG